ncbi:tetratricopeptide repeat protein [Terracidiphilus gabretensis]|jgi:TPR repeat protein|uniref:tetratricopeptide repeat protein n=1 Tax=Terracidiphilus gabretensis TaxID=1577687 RepID=UPI00071B293A|nr:tetratricopeptide repeat protein [Terracidiphilus gabretensis]
MPNKYVFAFVLVLLTLGGSLAHAQDEGPTIDPHPKSSNPHPPGNHPQDLVLTVTCDMPCKWSLDGILQATLRGQSDTARIRISKHTVTAESLDGLDHATREFTATDTTPVTQHMFLGPAREARFKAARDRQEQQDKAIRDAATQKTRQQAESDGKSAETDYEQKNYSGAAIFAISSCNAGNIVGCRVLGLLYLTGESVQRNYPRARALFEQSCKANDVRACNDVGWMAMRDLDQPHDYTKARTYTSAACNAGEMRGCLNFGDLLANGLGGDKDGPRALTMYTTACNGAYIEGCAYEGEGYANGLGGSPNALMAHVYLEKACNGASDYGCAWLGVLVENEHDFVKGRAVFEKACSGQDAIGCVGAAQDAIFARGGARDLSKARAELRKSCDLDNTYACNTLGENYSLDAQQDFNHGLELLRKACRGDNYDGCFDLGLDYELGYGTTDDLALARQGLRKFCQKPDDDACKELNVLHDNVTFIAEPYSEDAYIAYASQCQGLNLIACEILVKLPVQKNLPLWSNAADTYHTVQSALLASCIAGNPRACASLGEIFDKGLGIYRDAKLARYEFGVACSHGLRDACFRQKQVR